jgi:aspartate-semialdehyde dehydrogenase
MQTKRVAVVGATGLAGQQFLAALGEHPWFEVTVLAASERSAGKAYLDAIRSPNGAVQWFTPEPLPEKFRGMTVQAAKQIDPTAVDLIFTAVESDAARELEPLYARTTPVISTASAFRQEEDVPILVPGVNLEHAELLRAQQRRRGWKGFITPNPNCTTTGLAITLKPLHDRFGVQTVFMTSLQAVSGAGRSPGVIGLDIIDNVVPYIPGEEEKVERETRKILGPLGTEGIVAADFSVSCTCTRVPVLDGHTEAAFVSLREPASLDDVQAAWRDFGRELREWKLPSAPDSLIAVETDPFRPQPRLDRDRAGGMVTTVGRLRADAALPNGIKYLLVSHNTKMGAARGAILAAEALAVRGYLG